MATRLTLLAIAASLAAACGSTTAVPVGYCMAPQSISVEVAVKDSVSGAGRADSATGTLVSAAHSDSLRHFGSDTLMVGGQWIGTFAVTIDRPGYRTWSQPQVAVTQVGPCGNVIPVHLTALLQRS
jgi:hypothetical protein